MSERKPPDETAIREWAESVLVAYSDVRGSEIEQWGRQEADKRRFAWQLCAYTNDLPAHSVRSQMLTLLAELDVLRGELQRWQNALKGVYYATNEQWHKNCGSSGCVWCAARGVIGDERTRTVYGPETRDANDARSVR